MSMITYEFFVPSTIVVQKNLKNQVKKGEPLRTVREDKCIRFLNGKENELSLVSLTKK